ncbi:anti-sigma factor domain-containing protein [Roseibium sp.]|uniref:anti-sigma factor n=1 Tax=Roseibium sp. TaxID=1936156 RepID=UPI003A980003
MTDTFTPDEERQTLAGELVLGTLDALERQRADRLLESDPRFAAEVESWRGCLSPLDEAVAPVTVPDNVWIRIEAGIKGLEAQAEALGAQAEPGQVLLFDQMRRRVAFWRRSALAGGAIAACLAALVVSSPPTFLLQPLGLTPEVVRGQQFVAVVNRDGILPALLVQVDAAAGTIEVRSVSAERPTDKSLEVWYLEDDQPVPVSLGLVDATADVTRLASSRQDVLKGRNPLIAVTLEPLGGSPVEGPTGPIVYSGKLIPVE